MDVLLGDEDVGGPESRLEQEIDSSILEQSRKVLDNTMFIYINQPASVSWSKEREEETHPNQN